MHGAIWIFVEFIKQMGLDESWTTLVGMMLYGKLVDWMDAFWDATPSRNEKFNLRLSLAQIPIAGFGMGAAAVNSILGYLQHDRFRLECSMVGVGCAFAVSAMGIWGVLRRVKALENGLPNSSHG